MEQNHPLSQHSSLRKGVEGTGTSFFEVTYKISRGTLWSSAVPCKEFGEPQWFHGQKPLAKCGSRRAGVASSCWGSSPPQLGATIPPRDRANCFGCRRSCRESCAALVCPQRGGQRRSQHILRVTLKVLIINLIHAQMRFFFFLKHIALVLK